MSGFIIPEQTVEKPTVLTVDIETEDMVVVNTDEAIEGKESVAKSATVENGWRVNSAGDSKHRTTLCTTDVDFFHGLNGPECDMKSILEYHSLPYQAFVDGERKHLIKKEITFCIAWADSDLGRQLKSSNNIGNVGNNDRGQVVHYETIEKGIEAMYKVLNNKYLGHKQSVGSLSPGGGGNSPFYATSAENWNNNVLNCLNTILDPSIDENWNFRI